MEQILEGRDHLRHWHETAAGADESLWRRFCEQARAFPLLMGMKRGGVSYKKLFAQRATSNRRTKAGGRVVHAPPTREDYQLAVEVCTGAGKLQWHFGALSISAQEK